MAVRLIHVLLSNDRNLVLGISNYGLIWQGRACGNNKILSVKTKFRDFSIKFYSNYEKKEIPKGDVKVSEDFKENQNLT